MQFAFNNVLYIVIPIRLEYKYAPTTKSYLTKIGLDSHGKSTAVAASGTYCPPPYTPIKAQDTNFYT